jgi:hypothetical protein
MKRDTIPAMALGLSNKVKNQINGKNIVELYQTWALYKGSHILCVISER